MSPADGRNEKVPFDFAKKRMGGLNKQEQVVKEAAATAYAASFFLTMATHPSTKAQEEIDSVNGTHRLLEFENRPSLPYVGASREVMRWKPVLSAWSSPCGHRRRRIRWLLYSKRLTSNQRHSPSSNVISNIWQLRLSKMVLWVQHSEIKRYSFKDRKATKCTTIVRNNLIRIFKPSKRQQGVATMTTFTASGGGLRVVNAQDVVDLGLEVVDSVAKFSMECWADRESLPWHSLDGGEHAEMVVAEENAVDSILTSELMVSPLSPRGAPEQIIRILSGKIVDLPRGREDRGLEGKISNWEMQVPAEVLSAAAYA
ncbi:hypothetical protein C8J57DRAFT_1258838 [Mycena rebaudengoi]|nr:hypothetical protein C8J57DRAFT_1258838 [Mycena rebaudengoi]